MDKKKIAKQNDTSLEGFEVAFQHTVEGRPSHVRLLIENNIPILDYGNPIVKNSGANPELILQVLRCDIPLPKTFRNWIADLLDPNADSNFCYKNFSRRHAGQHPKWKLWDIEAALFVEERIKTDGYDSAITSAAEKFKIGRTKVKNAYSILKKARAEE